MNLALAASALVSSVGYSEEHAEEAEPLRIGVAATAVYGNLHRSVTRERDVSALGLGGELRVHPHSPHGFVVAYTHADGIFGPTVEIVDAGYSYRLVGPRHLRGVTGAVYFDAGPALGVVRDASPAYTHAVLGGRVSLAADAQLWNLSIGPILAYRGGVPLSGTPDGWEGALFVGLRVGLVFDDK